MLMPSISSHGPIFETVIPRIRKNGIIYSDSSVKKLIERVETKLVFSELGHPICEHWWNEATCEERLRTIEQTRAASRIVSVKSTYEFLFIQIQPVGNNLELYESGKYALAHRIFHDSPDAAGRMYAREIITFDTVLIEFHKDPYPLKKIT